MYKLLYLMLKWLVIRLPWRVVFKYKWRLWFKLYRQHEPLWGELE